jgi:hypothetical protein
MIKLTLQQKEALTGVEVYKDLYFGFTEDVNGYFFIHEMNQNDCDIKWVKDLIPSQFTPKQTNIF